MLLDRKPPQSDPAPPTEAPGASTSADEQPAIDLSDEDGLHAAFRAYGGALLGLAARALGDVSSGEEAVQETFLRAWRARQRFDPTLGSPRGWLFAIERRVIIDLVRARARRPRLLARHPDLQPGDRPGHPPSPDRIDELVRGLQLHDALSRLGAPQRHVLEKMYFEGLSGPETARALDIPEGTVRSRLHYALRSLRATLEEAGWDG